ncbi:prephenate dehydratase [Candidatus Methylacidiphilum fumarolicum]|uniref:prephenate dehydratase n=2 Tax=Candidatus Methylacidiphilum fumarolicum TaxID=591154 RepID=I0JWR1_METFB|nr:prephenate dehydratase domain-containing protein [Candidatus Methylacidiphilum fumarolicum]MBW6414376.1 prephenate dehydratase [Candidatus Methylacidiphilum fumarolicum]TFE67838.1 prephenate dehydratase [Candidatus Methylacidiphilum fumarolicum]TFE72987.1 prephenate dehydratase [Candidatus Methylacidiphilum fumarolicum]TFE75078.1 prephenate dehydratase [Candidatus Methylacidiphilum fumarolicum]TFE76299.1 prephenate dehydratase [Candidatus Methylacidiphilum fumarolicum]
MKVEQMDDRKQVNKKVGYLGPEATFSHLVVKKRFPDWQHHSLGSIEDIIEFVKTFADGEERIGLIPIENSTGGMILESVDLLLEEDFHLYIQEELSLNVQLALIGRKGQEIKEIYSHPTPLFYCRKWLKTKFPLAKIQKTASTSEAARIVSENPYSAALSTRLASEIYKLDILEFPVLEGNVNLTQFFVLSLFPYFGSTAETTIVFSVKDEPGSLCSFLEPFRDGKLNIKRIVSRPIPGKLNTYLFLLSVQAGKESVALEKALQKAEKFAIWIKSLGSYPIRETFNV